MTTFDLQLHRDTAGKWQLHGLPFRLRERAVAAVDENLPELSDMFVVKHAATFNFHVDEIEGWIAFRMAFDPLKTVMVTGPFTDAEIEFVRRHRNTPVADWGTDWASARTFSYLGQVKAQHASSTDMIEKMVDWMNDFLVQEALDRNRARVLRAIPSPPIYDLISVSRALWVLECDETLQQGTAFDMAGIGIVTCNHVLGKRTVAFRYDKPSEKFPVAIERNHQTIDLAVLQIKNGRTAAGLERGDPSILAQMDHILVTGHPNFRLGDTPMTVPGLVVGFRAVSGIRRMLTNAAIVSGASGGPVINAQGKVIGVGVTGPDTFAGQKQTEDISIIPIDALDLF